MVNLYTVRKELAKMCERRALMDAHPETSAEAKERLSAHIQEALNAVAYAVLYNEEVLDAAQLALDRYYDQQALERLMISDANIPCLYVFIEELDIHVECLWRGGGEPERYAATLVRAENGTYYSGEVRNIYHITENEMLNQRASMMIAYPAPTTDEIDVAVIRLDQERKDFDRLWLHDVPVNVNDRVKVMISDDEAAEGKVIYTYKVDRDTIHSYSADVYPL